MKTLILLLISSMAFGALNEIRYDFSSHKERAISIDGIKGENKYYLSTSFNLSYMLTRSSFVLNYSDETLFDVAKNTNLAKSFSFTYKIFEDL